MSGTVVYVDGAPIEANELAAQFVSQPTEVESL
jgi:hypothetical protein